MHRPEHLSKTLTTYKTSFKKAEHKMSIKIDVSVGEIMDKLTILDIKADKIDDTEKLANIFKERERPSASNSTTRLSVR